MDDAATSPNRACELIASIRRAKRTAEEVASPAALHRLLEAERAYRNFLLPSDRSST